MAATLINALRSDTLVHIDRVSAARREGAEEIERLRAALTKARPLVADRVAAQSGRICDGEYLSILEAVDAALTQEPTHGNR
ncbi:hypothetical protein ASG40_11460 [Methylobacterium sp. Leaf399]|uniref:hypothetical protein n=1 Tax=Methylobacterium sp. Leaf399 TaxID=1736364 RepID=UPI0006FBF5E4|nr:hypothetical protein [Methylobacterium sp. Leaf399]KQT08491.1 hypothetical protein ASG40_11460 [Methylobacterium sp. Leaf399]